MDDRPLDLAGAAADDIPLWRQRDLRLFVGARLAIAFSMQMQHVAIGWSLYVLTGDPLSLGVAGLIEFIPSILLMLVSGSAADRFDRRWLGAASATALSLASIALIPAMLGDAPRTWPIYAIIFVIGSARAFVLPALGALMPNIVSVADFPRALALNASSLQGSMIVGPALGGLLLTVNEASLFVLAAALNALAAVMILRLSVRAPEPDELAALTPPKEKTLASVLGGLAFLRANRLLLGAISLDLFAVLVGGVAALLPIFSRDILEAGPAGLGLLRACPALGAINYVFINASNQLGDFESSLIASFAGPRAAALFGGAGALAVVALWAKIFPELRKAQRLE